MPKGIRSYLIFLAVMSALGAFAYFFKTKTSKNKILYAQYYTEYPNGNMKAYTPEWKELSRCDQGHLFMQQKNFLEAKKAFIPNISIQDNCTDKSEWNLALIYILEGNISSANQLLAKIKYDIDSPYRGKAFELHDETSM